MFGLRLRTLLPVTALGILLVFILGSRYLAARERTRVATAILRLRETAVAVEAYFVDHEAYPACGMAEGVSRTYAAQQIWQSEERAIIPAGVATANSFAPAGSGARRLVTFRITDATAGASTEASNAAPTFATITTPIAYLEAFRVDPFARTKGASLGYFAHASRLGYILWSLGPDRDENAPGGPGDVSPRVERLYNINSAFPYMWEPTPDLIGAQYDPTNGLFSDGDIVWPGGK